MTVQIILSANLYDIIENCQVSLMFTIMQNKLGVYFETKSHTMFGSVMNDFNLIIIQAKAHWET